MFYKEEILSAPLAIKEESKKLKKPDNENPFDDFEFNDKDLNKVKIFLIDQYSVSVEETKKKKKV
ncbi:15144_t:CDS:2 [Cetraspora pellucida]|uniref:15144_t:CDS:1 n=1 Tax=Cetraspora pellucida TaxID=1433469 RepID=A0A9N9I106_9GLOM|nr:15144_t:CDS:2 [Cetraspora pellucida]